MTRDELEIAAAVLRNVSGALAERHRQEGQGSNPPFQFVYDTLSREATKLQVNGSPQLAEGLLAFRSAMMEADNG